MIRHEVMQMEAGDFGWDLRDQVLALASLVDDLATALREQPAKDQ